ncbi:MAG: amidase domain-containing protein [Eubacterium sp.]|nr:amidase domain-containing protein [Eubacterium sp.]
MLTYPLNIAAEIEYARKWAFDRNPAYYNFDDLGGDCTNFISQCLYAGGAAMNYTPDTGWYYSSLNSRAAAWTGVEFFYGFMVNNNEVGPFAEEVPLGMVQVGDVIQLGGSDRFYHNLLVVDIKNGMPYIACHTNDAFNMPLSAYRFSLKRCLHIIGARRYE